MLAEPKSRPRKSRGSKIAQNRRRIAETRELLATQFPLCFQPKGQPKLPLKLGIFIDIRRALPQLGRVQLGLALSDYTRGPTYLEALQEGADRVDLQGGVAGQVSAAHAAYAKARLAGIRKEQARLKEQADAKR